MDIPIDFNAITQMFEAAWDQGRNFLYEFEVYSLLARSGAETPPRCHLIERGSRPDQERMMDFEGDRTVLKIVSPTIVHKTEVGGVRIVKRDANKIRSTIRRMFYEVPENYALWLERYPQAVPPPYQGLKGDALLSAVSRDVIGVLQVQFMPPDSTAFGNELIVGLRHTREFGTILSAGLGGTDTELYAKRFRKGQAIVAASCAMNDGQSFFQMFRQTISYRKLAGLTRGQRRIVTDEQLIECFESFIEMGNTYSQSNPDAPFIIEELEINPFAFTDYLMVPLDGLCRFSKPDALPRKRPVEKIHHLLHPDRIGIVGVSATRKNFGRIILDNVIAEGFNRSDITVFKQGETHIDQVPCLPDINALQSPLDLFIVAVGAAQVPDLVSQVIEKNAAKSVMLIPGGMGETQDSQDRARQVIQQINDAHGASDGGPVFIGANCMGVVSRPGGYDTWFIPEQKLPKSREDSWHRAALISQSGAFMLHRSHQCPEMKPAYMISMGNQTDLTLGDMVWYFSESDQVDVIAVYAEGFNDLDGLSFCRAVQHAVFNNKEVIFYKAGRTAEGKAATSSHTASLAGDYMVCESCVVKAGATVARTFSEFQELMVLSELLSGKTVKGNRLAAVSGAGFEAVGMADSIQSDDFSMTLARFGQATENKIAALLKEKKLDAFVTIANPLDINPAADDDAHIRMVDILAADPNIDAVVVSMDPMSPAMKTLAHTDEPAFDMTDPGSVATRMARFAEHCPIPVVAVVDGGGLYDPLRQTLREAKIPVFNVCDKAIAALSLYIQGRLTADKIRASKGL